MDSIFLGIGSNLGDREKNLSEALKRIEDSIGIIRLRSSIYETSPWGFSSSEKFLNMVIEAGTLLRPSGLLGRILMIEAQMGRVRNEKQYRSRIIDIDILFFGNRIIDKPALVVPHPHLHERKFVLVPLAELIPGFIHPVFNNTISALLESCSDTGEVKLYRRMIRQ